MIGDYCTVVNTISVKTVSSSSHFTTEWEKNLYPTTGLKWKLDSPNQWYVCMLTFSITQIKGGGGTLSSFSYDGLQYFQMVLEQDG
jgi:hypothetical protein